MKTSVSQFVDSSETCSVQEVIWELVEWTVPWRCSFLAPSYGTATRGEGGTRFYKVLPATRSAFVRVGRCTRLRRRPDVWEKSWVNGDPQGLVHD